jgi:hypothetical protein
MHNKNINTDGQPSLVVKHPDGEKVKPTDQLWRIMLRQFRITGQEKSGHGIEAVLINEIFSRALRSAITVAMESSSTDVMKTQGLRHHAVVQRDCPQWWRYRSD